jgi:Txe/YoeB family toxin of Txe-Axe toxin-antitoxin module
MALQKGVTLVKTGVQIIRNDGKTKIQASYEIVKFRLISYFSQKVNDYNKLQEQKKCRMLKFDDLVKSPCNDGFDCWGVRRTPISGERRSPLQVRCNDSPR